MIAKTEAQSNNPLFFKDATSNRYRLSFLNDGYFSSDALAELDTQLKGTCTLYDGVDGIPIGDSIKLCPAAASGDTRATLDRLSSNSMQMVLACIVNNTNTFCVNYDRAHPGSNSNKVVIDVLIGLATAVGFCVLLIIGGALYRKYNPKKPPIDEIEMAERLMT